MLGPGEPCARASRRLVPRRDARRHLDGLHDGPVPGAATEVPGDGLADPSCATGDSRARGAPWPSGSRPTCRSRTARRRTGRRRRGADGIRRSAQRLGGRDLLSFARESERDAREDRSAVDEHGARAAVPLVAPLLGSDENRGRHEARRGACGSGGIARSVGCPFTEKRIGTSGSSSRGARARAPSPGTATSSALAAMLP